jgi:hypothetical protein
MVKIIRVMCIKDIQKKKKNSKKGILFYVQKEIKIFFFNSLTHAYKKRTHIHTIYTRRNQQLLSIH